MEQRPPRVPKLAWVEEEEEVLGAAPIEEIAEVVPFEPLQEDAAVDRTQEQDPARGLFRRTAQLVCKFIKRIREEETSTTGTGFRAYSHIFKTKTCAALLDMLVEEGFCSPKQLPAMVRYIHQWLMANQFAEHRLNRALLDLTKEQPADVVMMLLRVAPSCDRAAFTMWNSIMCSPRTAEPVQLILLDVLGSWPEHSMCTSDGDKTGVFVLAATVVMWKILQVPSVPHMVTVYFPHLLVHLLFQVFFSTLDMPEEVDTFWKGCQQQYGLATSPNRFAVRTLKSLLCQMQHEDVVVAMERKCGWDTLLCADTHHYAVGLLAREISRVSIPLCSRIARYLLRLLSTQEPRWELPALAFLVEVLECLNLSEHGANRVLQILSRHLRSECRDRRCLALRALLKLIDDPSMREKMWSLTESLVELLRDADGEIVSMTVMLLSFIFWDKDTLIASPIALQLVEALLPLFDHDNSQVQLLSILLFQALLSLPLEKDEKAQKTHVHQSLLPLFFHCHDENRRVAEASQEMLLCVAQFLQRRDLEKVVRNKKLWKFTECLLADDRSRAAEHVHRALPYLESPQDPLREAAVRFLGIAGRQLRGKKEELQLICEALESMANDISIAVGSLAIQTLYILQAVERARYSIFDSLHDQLCRAWRARPRLLGLGWLRCWSSAES
ncbi:maestro heat-like repeat family member 5 [Vidua macroura]|uniref:maestro heat-like repeat family member 5 n=1 Tax=Vidua macroura TaxID=187451 RepID=UPI0023A81226|nr:maestro heat-like repeat family member 5 [Vidua macroura]XP_053860564.1 maestro heat-like repeat family member 5 [Vidua macroura]